MKKFWAMILVILAAISLVVSIIYFTHTAGNIPSFFLGYAKHSSHKHIKHAIAFLTLTVVLLIAAWIISGDSDHSYKNTSKRPNSEEEK